MKQIFFSLFLCLSTGEPNNVGDDGEHCVEMYSGTGDWNDNWCEKGSGYICKQSGKVSIAPMGGGT